MVFLGGLFFVVQYYIDNSALYSVRVRCVTLKVDMCTLHAI